MAEFKDGDRVIIDGKDKGTVMGDPVKDIKGLPAYKVKTEDGVVVGATESHLKKA